MAKIVFGVGTSHSPLLNSPAEDYARHADVDRSGRKLFDKDGVPRTYGELVAMADPAIVDQLRMEVLEERAATRISTRLQSRSPQRGSIP